MTNTIPSKGERLQLTKQIGEYLVSAQLCRLNWISTTFTGNVPDFDIVALRSGETRRVQVKTILGGGWQFDARKYIKIDQLGKEQHVKGKVKFSDDDIILVFVVLKDINEDEYYICSIKDVQNLIFRSYKKYLKAKNHVRPRNPKSYHSAFSPKDIQKFKDNWDAYF